MLKHWKLWLSAIVVALLYALAGESPVDGIVQYGIIGGTIGLAAALADVGLNVFKSDAEKTRKKQLERQAKKKVSGLSGAQRQGMMADALRGIRGTEASATADLRRQAAAAGGFGRSGRVQKLMGQQGQQTREFQAKVGADIQKLSQARFDENLRRKEAAQAQLAADAAEKRKAISTALGRVAGVGVGLSDDIGEELTKLLGKKN